MTEPHDQHAHRNPDVVEQPLDAANQSLADALRSSFSVLKAIMVVLVVLYLFSNVRSVASHEQALVLRMGKLLPEVHEAGLMWAFPFPIDEIIPLPTNKSNELLIKSHTFHRTEREIGKPLSFISRSPRRGLDPSLDGALLTADTGLVHVQWKVTYKFDDVGAYVSRIAGDKIEAAEKLITILVETTGIEVATELTAEEMIRTRVDHVQREMLRRVNHRLKELDSGVRLTLVEMVEPTPPLQVRSDFDTTQRAENAKQQQIRGAQKARTEMLSKAAGSAYKKLEAVFGALDRAEDDDSSRAVLLAELDRLLAEEAEGEAGRRIKDAGSYRAVVVSRMEADVQRYRMLLPEYRRNPLMLINRLWEETKQKIFSNPGVTKIYRPRGVAEFRLIIPLDPEEKAVEQRRRLEKKEFDVSTLRPAHMVPVGPEYD